MHDPLSTRRRGPAALFALLSLLSSGLAAFPATATAAEPVGPVQIRPEQRRALGIELIAPEPSGRGSRTWPATVVSPPGETQWVAAPVAGLLVSVAVEPNQPVAAGAPVATLQSPQLPEAAAAWLQSRSQSELAERTAERERALLAEGVIPAARVRQAEAAAEQARAQLDARRAQLRLLGLTDAEIGRLTVRAPLPTTVTLRSPAAGVVAEVAADAGQRVEAGAAIARLARPDRLVLEIRVPPAEAASLRPGSPVHDLAGRAIATLGAPAGAVGSGQTLALRARLDPRAGRWLLGQALEVRLETGRPGWRLPRAALTRSGEGYVVFVERDARLVPVPVELEVDEGDRVVVTGPLEPGMRVASGNLAALKAASGGTR